MVSWEDLRFFSILREAASLAAGSRALGVSASAVTQRLRALGSRLGVRLIDRPSGRLQLTAEGDILAVQGGAMLAQIDALTVILVRHLEITVSGDLQDAIRRRSLPG